MFFLKTVKITQINYKHAILQYNQLNDKNHCKIRALISADNECSQRVVDRERGRGFGSPKFIPYVALNYKLRSETQYLEDDTLVFRVSVEIPNYKPWLESTV